MKTFEDVVRADSARLLRYANTLCGDPSQALDMTQEILARAFVRWEVIGRTDMPTAYLMRMITNEYLSWKRRWSTRNISLTDMGSMDEIDTQAPDPSDRIALRTDLEDRLSRLPRRQRAVIVLRYFEDLDYVQVADVLGCPESTIRSLCARGLAAMRVDDTAPSPQEARK